MMSFEPSTSTEEFYQQQLWGSAELARSFFRSDTQSSQVILDNMPNARWGGWLLDQLDAIFVSEHVMDDSRVERRYACRDLGGFVVSSESFPSGLTTFSVVRATEQEQIAA